MGTVQVIGRRLLIDPPELGHCQDPNHADPAFEPGEAIDVPLVAIHQVPVSPLRMRVCAACDWVRLRGWMAEP